MNPLECVGWNPPLSLLHRLSDAGYAAPWEMTPEVFEAFVQTLSPNTREEFDRIDRALHSVSDLPEVVRFYEEMLEAQDPALVRRLRGIGPGDMIRIFRVIPAHEEQRIRPGDLVALNRSEILEKKGRGRIVSIEVEAKDVDWPGRSTEEWVYAPALCRNYEAPVHDFLVAYALDAGLPVPAEVHEDYILRSR